MEPTLKPAKGRSEKKRLICCADGTWLASDLGGNTVPSNVAKIARVISTEGIDDDGKIVPQVVMYQSGLGSGALPFQKAIAGGIGLGLDNDVCQMYDFLANNYKDGDELFFFGFSRGAYIVRSVAGLVGDVGILPAVKMTEFHNLWKAYRRNNDDTPFKDTPWFDHHKESLGLRSVKIKFIGVWDTVGSLGIPEWPLVQHAKKLGFDVNKIYGFHNTHLSANVENAYQALALDEQRLTFPPTLWKKTDSTSPSQVLQQCWFPGVHGNIGGQSEMFPNVGDHEEIGYNSLAWMIDNASGMLTFVESGIETLLKEHAVALKKVDETGNIHRGWGAGTIVSNFAGVVGHFFWLLGKQTRAPGALGAVTNETFHPIVRIRKNKLQEKWQPESLAGFESLLPKGERGWRWQRRAAHIPEWRMLDNKMLRVREGENGSTKFKDIPGGMSRKMCPEEILEDLDRDAAHVKPNGTTNGHAS